MDLQNNTNIDKIKKQHNNNFQNIKTYNLHEKPNEKSNSNIDAIDNSTADKQNIINVNILTNLDKKKKKKVLNNITASNLTSNLDKKKKKRTLINIDLDKKKKKRIQTLTGIPWELLNDKIKKRFKNDGMKQKLCGLRYGNFIDIDVDDRTVYWGLGIEHEMQLFHLAPTGMKNTHIMFDSQESTCFLSGDMHQVGSCCKMQKPCFYHPKKEDDDFVKLNIEERRFLSNMQWELTGRQAKGCQPDPTIIKRVSILMPELITTNFTNRTIDSITKEIRDLESKFINLQMRNPHTLEKIAKYGKLTTHTCGSSSEILVPIRPTINSPEYQFEPVPMTDYLGSYHLTITLPYTRDITKKEYISMHREMANQIQWLEPLLTCGFFSPTENSVGKFGNNKDTEGSYRVMNIGWGNFGGSNVRKIGTKGLDRGANIFPYWRKGFHFQNTKRLDECAQSTPPYYKKAKSIHTGDFRTFGFEPNMEKCIRDYRAEDCPKADGAPIKQPYGIEIRIFDHFPSEYLIELMRIIVLISANSMRHPAKEYVYRDKRWITALRDIMTDGWNTTLANGYVSAIRKNFGIPVETHSHLAIDILKTVVHELYIINKDSFFNRVMNEHPEIEPIVPDINRKCWEMAFTQKYNLKIVNMLKKLFYKGQIMSVNNFAKIMSNAMGINDWQKWSNDVNDLLYALETHNHVSLDVYDGKIKNVKIV